MSFASVENYWLVFCGYYHGELLDRSHGGLLSSGNCWCLQFLGRSVSDETLRVYSPETTTTSTTRTLPERFRPRASSAGKYSVLCQRLSSWNVGIARTRSTGITRSIKKSRRLKKIVATPFRKLIVIRATNTLHLKPCQRYH